MSRVLFSIGVVQVLIVLVGIGRSKVLSVLLGPAGFGVVSTIDQVALTLVHLGTLSVPFTAMKFMSHSHSDGLKAFQRTYRSFLRILTLLVVTATTLATAILAWWPGVFGRDLFALSLPLQIAILGVPALALNNFFINTLAAAQRPSSAAGLSLLATLMLAVAAIVGERVGGLSGLYVATVFAGVLTTAGTLVYLHRSLGLRLAGPTESLLRELRQRPEFISYSAYFYLLLSAYSLTMLATRYYVFSRLGAAEAGLLQALLSVALTVGAVLAPMSNLFLSPLLNRRLPAPDKVRAANDFAGKTLVLLLLASLPVILFPQIVLATLFSGRFVAGANSLFLFVLWQCLFQVVNVYQQLLIGLDDVLFVSVAALAGFGTAALLAPVLVSALGLGGAAMALTIGMAVYGVVAAVRLRARFASGLPVGFLIRLGYVLVVVLMAGSILNTSTELSLVGMAERFAFALAALGIFWMLLGSEERHFVSSGFGLLPHRPRVRP